MKRLYFLLILILLLISAITGGYYAYNSSSDQGLWWRKLNQAYKNNRVGKTEPFLFDTVYPDAQEAWANHWMMMPGQKPNEWDILAVYNTRVWLLKGELQDTKTLSLTGHWAEYTDNTARTFQYGDVAGIGRRFRQARNEEMTVSLTFTNAQDARQFTHSFLIRPAASPEKWDTHIRRIEQDDYFQPILFNELFPRNQQWADYIEQQILAKCSTRVIVPLIGSSQPVPQIDGDVSSNEWLPPYVDHPEESGYLSPQYGLLSSKMQVCCDSRNFYLKLEYPASIKSPRITVRIMNRFRVPVHDSPKWSVQFSENQLEGHQCEVGGHLSAWECQWKAASKVSGDHWITEVQIPFANMENKSIPVQTMHWRMNCLVADAESPDKPLIKWGSQDPLTVENGIILSFSEQ